VQAFIHCPLDYCNDILTATGSETAKLSTIHWARGSMPGRDPQSHSDHDKSLYGLHTLPLFASLYKLWSFTQFEDYRLA